MKIESVNMEGMKMIAGIRVTFLQNAVNFLLTVVKYTFLLTLLFLLASHESANPKKGRTNFEFYSAEFRSAFIEDSGLNIEMSGGSELESDLVKEFYNNRQYLPAWTNNFDVKPTFIELVDLIKNAYQYGLLPSFYNYNQLTWLESQLDQPISDEQKMRIRVQLEQYATWSAIHLMSHLSNGIIQSDTSNTYKAFMYSLPWYLSLQIDNNTLREGILGMQPKSKPYVRLQRAMSRFINQAFTDTIEYTAEEIGINKNVITNRLISQGYLDASFVSDTNAIQTAIRSYQKSHCIEVTGKTDENTIDAFTSDVKDVFFKIAINLDRLRKDELTDQNSILVNIPEFRLYYFNDQGISKEFNVIVGKKETPTPILNSQIEWIIANPYWTVPNSITRNEIIPLLKKDSLYLERNGFSVVDKDSKPVDASGFNWSTMDPADFTYYFRQGNDNNALGTIKFLFPNPHSVYLHDTPAKKLFEKRIRTFSHGCIRVQNPEELAQIIISSYCKSSKDLNINKVINRKKHREIKIEKSLPIYIRYYSCTVDSSGNINFHPDIYAMDEAAINELFGKTAWD